MFDFDAGKLMIIGVVALVVIGPKDLPRVLRQVGQMVGRLRRMAGEFQGQFMDAMKEADLQDLRAEVAKLKDSATLDVDFDPAKDIQTHMTAAVNAPAPIVPYSHPPGVPSNTGSEIPRLPGHSEIPAEPITSGIGGSAALPESIPAIALDEAPAVPDPAAETGELAPARRKVVIKRRRFGSAPEASVPAPAATRPRHLLPARRESVDR